MDWHIATENWPWPISKRKDIRDAIRKLNEAAHAAGLKMNPYAFHIRFPLGVEEFQTYGRSIAQLPLKVSAWGNGAGQGIDAPRPGSVRIRRHDTVGRFSIARIARPPAMPPCMHSTAE